MKKKQPKKQTVKLWVELPVRVAQELSDLADADGRARKPYIQKLLIQHANTSTT